MKYVYYGINHYYRRAAKKVGFEIKYYTDNCNNYVHGRFREQHAPGTAIVPG